MALNIPVGVTALAEDDEPLPYIDVEVICDGLPPPPPNALLLGCAFDFKPDGATFDPPIPMILPYDPGLIPEGIPEEDLVVASYDAATGQWTQWPCSVDTDNNIITAWIGHFTLFGVISESDAPAPAPTPVGWWYIGVGIAVVAVGLGVSFVVIRRRRVTRA